jgi:hypothetical protein
MIVVIWGILAEETPCLKAMITKDLNLNGQRKLLSNSKPYIVYFLLRGTRELVVRAEYNPIRQIECLR